MVVNKMLNSYRKMLNKISYWRSPSLIGVVLLSVLQFPLLANSIGFDEDFSLSGDRKAALSKLISGTDEYFYYQCLYDQLEGKYDSVESRLTEWRKKVRHSGLRNEIEYRQALYRYEQHPTKSLDFIIKKMGVRFNHQMIPKNKKSDYSNKFPQDSIAYETLKQKALKSHRQNLRGFETRDIESLAAEKLSFERRRELLNRLQRPDVEGLAQLVIDDLNSKHSRGFGSLGIHNKLLLSQLQQCLTLKPDLIQKTKFIQVYLRRLQPREGLKWQNDPKEHEKYLERMWGFVKRLPPSQNSLKVHVILHHLRLDMKQGDYSLDRFMEYIKLPRHVHYINHKYFNDAKRRNVKGNLYANFKNETLMSPAGNDGSLVATYLRHFLKDMENTDQFAPYIESGYLKKVFAEAKLIHGVGDASKWLSLISASEVKMLKERIDLKFAHDNKEHYGLDDAVALKVKLKNVKALLVKIYEINSFNYYKTYQREISTALDLDGLQANVERKIDYNYPAMRQHTELIDIPEIKKPGVYIVELIGNGKSSRALIRKGNHHFTYRSGSAGHVFTIYNHALKPIKNASIYLAGRLIKPDEEGEIAIPYSNRPGRQSFIIKGESFSSLHHFNHEKENYELSAGFVIDSEMLIDGKETKVMIRPHLKCGKRTIDVKLLENVSLNVVTTDLNGIKTTKSYSNLKLQNYSEFTQDFRSPHQLTNITFTLKAKIRNVSQGKDVHLSASKNVSLAGIHHGDKTNDIFLRERKGGYVLEVRGKNGEAIDGMVLHLELKHRSFTDKVRHTLQTNEQGKINLGKLYNIEYIYARSQNGVTKQWPLHDEFRSYQRTIFAKEGEAVQFAGQEKIVHGLSHTVSLFEKRHGNYISNELDKVSYKNGFWNIKGLKAGNYELYLKREEVLINIVVEQGTIQKNYLISENRFLPLQELSKLNIGSVEIDEKDKKLRFKVENADQWTRLHILGHQFEAVQNLQSELTQTSAWKQLPRTPFTLASQFLSGRSIGEEYRYILERRLSEVFPGNLLERPSLLLNPWNIRKTESDTRSAKDGQKWDDVSAGAPGDPAAFGYLSANGVPVKDRRGKSGHHHNFTSYGFLNRPAFIFSNLKADEKTGVVELPLDSFQFKEKLSIIAIRGEEVLLKKVLLDNQEDSFRDLRMNSILDPKKHYSEQKQISQIAKGSELVVENIATSKIEVNDSLKKVYNLFITLTNNSKLRTFEFVTRWPSLTQEEKLKKYSEFACHELNFFIYQKDPEFFKRVVKPYLIFKEHKTFIDHWLLDDNLLVYLEPWKFHQLNIAEQTLLAMKLQSIKNSTKRDVRERFELIPENVDQYNRLFNTVLSSSALGESLLGGKFAEAKREAAQSIRKLKEMQKQASASQPMSRMMKEKSFDKFALADEEARAEIAMDKAVVTEYLSKVSNQAMFFKSNAIEDKKDGVRRKQQRAFYRKLNKTEEWVENHYYRVPLKDQNQHYIVNNAFWNDVARNEGKVFSSKNFTVATKNFSEMMFVLSLMDLPFDAEEHDVEFKDSQMRLKAKSELLAFHEKIQETELSKEKIPFLISQNYFDIHDRYRYEGREKMDKFVEDEFIKGNVYGCQLVMSNPTSSRRKVKILLQIPDGAMPVSRGFQSKSIEKLLNPFTTTSFTYYFYFPVKGKFDMYPAQVAYGNKVIAYAEKFSFNVVDEATKVDETSWRYVSQYGSDDEVIKHIEKNNIQRLDLNLIAFRMKEKAFFTKMIPMLKNRHVYSQTLWSYALKHNQKAEVTTWIENSGYLNSCGMSIDSSLVKSDPVERKIYEHKEYWPLVHSRAHVLGKKREIMNRALAGQYKTFLRRLRYEGGLDHYDKIEAVYYFLLQDRIKEGISWFEKIDPSALAGKIQYDYLKAYLAFYRENVSQAEMIAKKYADYPVVRWRNRFAEILSQVSEIAGKGAVVVDEDNRRSTQAKLAATEASFDFEIENEDIRLQLNNVEEIEVKYYPMDVELLFSRKPFVKEVGGQFSFIRPHSEKVQKIAKNQKELSLALPKEYRDKNVMIEVSAAGQSLARAHYPNALSVQMQSNYGWLKVMHEKSLKGLSKVYIKVYAKYKNGQVQFYKDGYTDLRGRFDYTSLNTDEITKVDSFSVLVMSDEHGAVIREARPPKM